MNDIEIAQAVSIILSKFTKATPDEAPATSEAARVDGLDEIVAKALAQHSSVRDASAISQVAKVANASTGAFDTMDEAISAAVLAQVQYRHCSMQDRASFINGIRDVFPYGGGRDRHGELRGQTDQKPRRSAENARYRRSDHQRGFRRRGFNVDRILCVRSDWFDYTND